MRRLSRRYLIAAGAVLAFGLLYECFGHGVLSAFMLGAFLVPLAGGALPCFLLYRFGKLCMPGALPFRLWHFGLAALTVGCVIEGVLDIYGTTNQLIYVYWYVGGGLAALAVVLYGLAWFSEWAWD